MPLDLLNFIGGGIGSLMDEPGKPSALTNFTNAVNPERQVQMAQANLQNQQALQSALQNHVLQTLAANPNMPPQQKMAMLANFSPEMAYKQAETQYTNDPFGANNPQQSSPVSGLAALPGLVDNSASPSPAPSKSPLASYNAQPTAADSTDKRNWDYLKTLPAQYQGVVQGLAEGDEQAGAVARSSPIALALNDAAKKFDPTFSATAYSARNKTATDFSPGGASGKTIVAANTGTKHLAQLAVDAYDMHNTGTPLANYFKLPWQQHLASSSLGGTSAPSKFDADVVTVAPELDKVNSGTGASSDTGTGAQVDSFVKYGKPSDQFGAIASKVGLLQSKADELGNSFKSVMNREKQIITPENKDILGKLKRLSILADAEKIDSPEAKKIIDDLRGKVGNPDTTQTPTPSAPAAINQVPAAAQTDLKPQALAILKARGKL